MQLSDHFAIWSHTLCLKMTHETDTCERMPKAFFIQTRHGPCFCLFHEPKEKKERGSILYLHPFAEELNTTRRIVAQQARNLAELGYGVLQVDLFGCGDSAGNFEDATWDAWLDTAHEALEWLKGNSLNPIWFWGLRAGALLATELLKQHHKKDPQQVNLLLWQPVSNGQQMLKQLMRLKDAGEWVGAKSSNTKPADKIWEQGGAVEIAGYVISSELAGGLAKTRIAPSTCETRGILVWIEVSSHITPTLSPASEKSLSLWSNAGWNVQANAVSGNNFWQNISTADTPNLWSVTKDAMEMANKLKSLGPNN